MMHRWYDTDMQWYKWLLLRLSSGIIQTSQHLVAIQSARWGHQGWHRLPRAALHWSMVQLMDICQSPTTADPATVGSEMKYLCNKDSGGSSGRQH